MKRVIIIGAGPAGLIAAISAKTHYPIYEVIILERNEIVGKKLRLTGGGRCNVTCDISLAEFIEWTPKNAKFLYSTLNNFNSKDVIKFFEKNNCPLKKEDHNRMFPKSDKAIDIINVLLRKINELKIKIIYNTLVTEVKTKEKTLITNKKKYNYDYLIIATGGITYPQTGSDGIGYKLATMIGHTITELLPAEVPLVSNDEVITSKALLGLSFKDVKLKIKNKEIIHDLIFTHFGISGPAALRASYYVIEELKKKNLVTITIDFFKDLSKEEISNLPKNELTKHLPKRFINYLESISKTKEEFINLLKNFPLSIYTTKGLKMAFVTNGGVSIKEIDPKTMKSKIDNSVSFCGEIIDVNSFTGGLNITLAFSTGYTAGKYLVNN